MLARDKRSSFFGLLIGDKGKHFILLLLGETVIKCLTETNTPAYFASVTKEKSFVTLRPRPNVIKLFTAVI